MYEELKEKGFAVLGFPCNDYGGQEPGSRRDPEVRERL
jgi:glutathione peroxidase